MIKILEGFSGNVLGFIAEEHLTREDYMQVAIPAVEAALKNHDKLRVYYEFSPSFSSMEPGAAWEDFKLGMSHISSWEKAAIVTDLDWIKYSVNAFRFIIPCEIKVFSLEDSDKAKKWIES